MKKELQIKEQKIIMNMHNELNVIKSDLKHVKDNIKKNNVKLQIINQIPDKLLKSP